MRPSWCVLTSTLTFTSRPNHFSTGTKRNTHNLTDETRKKNRRSRRCECPMYCVASKSTSDLWELTVRNGEHNHEPYEPPASKSKKKRQFHTPPPLMLHGD